MNRRSSQHLRPQAHSGHGIWPIALLCALGIGCSEQQPPAVIPALSPDPATTSTAGSVLGRQSAKVSLALIERGQADLHNSVTLSQNLLTVTDNLLEKPDAIHLEQARQAWHKAHEAFHRATPLLLLAKVHPELFPNTADLHFAIDAWPLEPGYIDSFQAYANSGIVNDVTVNLDESGLRQQHGFSSNTEIALGFHSLEYLLWGEGERLAEAFYPRTNLTDTEQALGLSLEQLPNNRRREYLRTLTQLLHSDIDKLYQLWLSPHSEMQSQLRTILPSHHRQLWLKTWHYYIAQQVLPQLEGNPDLAGYEQYHSPFALSGADQAAALTPGLDTLVEILETSPGLADNLVMGNRTIKEQLLSHLKTGHQQLLQEPQQTLPEQTETKTDSEAAADSAEPSATPASQNTTAATTEALTAAERAPADPIDAIQRSQPFKVVSQLLADLASL